MEQNRLKIEQSIEMKLFQTENHLDVKYVVINLLLQKVLKLTFKKNYSLIILLKFVNFVGKEKNILKSMSLFVMIEYLFSRFLMIK